MFSKVPKNWIQYYLGEITDVIGGGTPSTNNPEYWDGKIPWLTPKDLSGYNQKYIAKGERSITKLGLEKSSAKLMPADSVLFTSRAPIGYVAIAKNEICTNQGFKSFICHSKLFPDFLYYYLMRNKSNIENLAGGSTFKEISGTRAKQIEIPIPPTLSEQQDIVEVLDLAANIVKLRQEAIDIAEQIVPAVFYEMFGDPVSNEKNLPTTIIGQVTFDTKQINPKNLKKENFFYVDIASINNDSGIIEEPKYLSVNEAPSRARKLIEANDVLISTTRPYLRGFAKVPENLNGEIASTGFAVLKCHKDKILPDYLFSFVRTQSFLDQIIPLMRGASYPAVTDKDVRSVKIILPSINDQEQFVEIAKEFDNLLKEHYEAKRIAEEEFQSLLNMAFTGELTARKYSGVS